LWVVGAWIDGAGSAVETASWFAELGPEVMSPPATFTGTLALTAFCLLIAAAPAHCWVSADWTPICAAPAPPHPTWQDEVSPTYWFWFCFCSVSASFDAFESAFETAAWLAELVPE